MLQDEVARALVVRGVGVKHSQNLRCRRAGAVLMDSGTDRMDSVTGVMQSFAHCGSPLAPDVCRLLSLPCAFIQGIPIYPRLASRAGKPHLSYGKSERLLQPPPWWVKGEKCHLAQSPACGGSEAAHASSSASCISLALCISRP